MPLRSRAVVRNRQITRFGLATGQNQADCKGKGEPVDEVDKRPKTKGDSRHKRK